MLSTCIHCLHVHWTHSAPFPRLMSSSNVPKYSQHSYSCPSSCHGIAVVGMGSFIFAIVPSAKSFLDLTSSLVSGTSATLLDDGRSESIGGAVNVSCCLRLVLLVDCKVAFYALFSPFLRKLTLLFLFIFPLSFSLLIFLFSLLFFFFSQNSISFVTCKQSRSCHSSNTSLCCWWR